MRLSYVLAGLVLLYLLSQSGSAGAVPLTAAAGGATPPPLGGPGGPMGSWYGTDGQVPQTVTADGSTAPPPLAGAGGVGIAPLVRGLPKTAPGTTGSGILQGFQRLLNTAAVPPAAGPADETRLGRGHF
jgi:hypothetical protein